MLFALRHLILRMDCRDLWVTSLVGRNFLTWSLVPVSYGAKEPKYYTSDRD